jgi:hypothetical protein
MSSAEARAPAGPAAGRAAVMVSARDALLTDLADDVFTLADGRLLVS